MVDVKRITSRSVDPYNVRVVAGHVAVVVDVDAVEVRLTRRVVWVRSVDLYNVRVVAGHVAVDVDVDAVEVCRWHCCR